MNLTELLNWSKRLHKFHDFEDEIFDYINKLATDNSQIIDSIISKYKPILDKCDVKRSARLIRLAVAYRLKKGLYLTPEDVTSLKHSFIFDTVRFFKTELSTSLSHNHEKVPEQTFKHWNSDFKLLFPFLIPFEDLKKTQNLIKQLAHKIIEDLDLKGDYTATTYSFEGVTNKGDDSAWFSLYPIYFKPERHVATGHSNAFQFHCRIRNGRIEAGKFPGTDITDPIAHNFEQMHPVNDYMGIYKIFKKYKKDVIAVNDYLKASGEEQHVKISSIEDDIRISNKEGKRIQKLIQCINRNIHVMQKCKERDNYQCKCCGFKYKDLIVHAHHMLPLAEDDRERIPKLEDLITLCPTCHAVAHHILESDSNSIYRHNVSELMHQIRAIIQTKNSA